MMSYRMQIDAKSRNAGRFVRRVQKELQTALVRSGLRQQQVAERLGIDRSIVNRRVTGNANLTLRSIADLAWALDHDLVFSLKPRTVVVSANEYQANVEPVAAALPVGDFNHSAPIPWNSHVKIHGAGAAQSAAGSQTTNGNVVSKNVVRHHEGA